MCAMNVSIMSAANIINTPNVAPIKQCRLHTRCPRLLLRVVVVVVDADEYLLDAAVTNMMTIDIVKKNLRNANINTNVVICSHV